MADIQDKIRGVEFSIYTKEEIQKLSCKQIINPIAFDNLNRPTKNGLYDPALGISPYDKVGKCETCGQEQSNCYGHIGHIELAGPVYNPLLFNELIKLLKRKCFSCHRIRIPPEKITYLILKLKLIKLGYILEADSLSPGMLDFKSPKKDKKQKSESEDAAQFLTFLAESKIANSKEKITDLIELIRNTDMSKVQSNSTSQNIALK